MSSSDRTNVDLLANIVAESLEQRDFYEFIKDSCTVGCFVCGKKLKEIGSPYTVVRHYRNMASKQDLGSNWEQLGMHRGALQFLEKKLAQIFPDVPDTDAGKILYNFLNICSIGEVDRRLKERVFQANDKYVIPATGILVNLPSKYHRGEIAPRFHALEILQYLQMKGYEPVSVNNVHDPDGFCKCALVDFGTSFHGFLNARSFEVGLILKGFGKAQWETQLLQITSTSNVFGWIAMEEDLYSGQGFCRLAVSEKLQKKIRKEKIRVLRYVDFLRELNTARISDASSSSVNNESDVAS